MASIDTSSFGPNCQRLLRLVPSSEIVPSPPSLNPCCPIRNLICADDATPDDFLRWEIRGLDVSNFPVDLMNGWTYFRVIVFLDCPKPFTNALELLRYAPPSFLNFNVINCGVQGTIPDIFNPIQHASLDFINIRNEPGVFGTLPPSLQTLPRFAGITLENTSITFPTDLDSYFAGMRNLRVIQLPNNPNLNSTFPTQTLSNLPDLFSLRLDNSNLYGSLPEIPPEVHARVAMNLTGNCLTAPPNFNTTVLGTQRSSCDLPRFTTSQPKGGNTPASRSEGVPTNGLGIAGVVGVALGIPIFCAIIAFLVIQWRKKRNGEKKDADSDEDEVETADFAPPWKRKKEDDERGLRSTSTWNIAGWLKKEKKDPNATFGVLGASAPGLMETSRELPAPAQIGENTVPVVSTLDEIHVDTTAPPATSQNLPSPTKLLDPPVATSTSSDSQHIHTTKLLPDLLRSQPTVSAPPAYEILPTSVSDMIGVELIPTSEKAEISTHSSLLPPVETADMPDSVCTFFLENQISGKGLQELDLEILRKEMQGVGLGVRLEVWGLVKGLRRWAGVGLVEESTLLPPGYIGSEANLKSIPRNLTLLPTLQSIFIENNTQITSIPDFLPDFPLLTELSLRNCSIGSIPESLLSLYSLEVLDLSWNPLGSKIPNLSGLYSLKELYLNVCNLYGELPPTLGFLPLLKTLQLGFNGNLEGTIPSELGLLYSLENLYLGGNKFSGELPEEIGLLANLQFLSLNDNKFEGPLPETFRLLQNLTSIDLENNKLLEGTLDVLAPLKNLKVLDVSGCRFTGELPQELGIDGELEYLDVSNNEITGAVPQHLQNIQTLDITNNCLISFPQQRANCTPTPLPPPIVAPPTSPNTTTIEEGKGTSQIVAISLGVVSGVVVLIVVGLVWAYKMKHRSSESRKAASAGENGGGGFKVMGALPGSEMSQTPIGGGSQTLYPPSAENVVPASPQAPVLYPGQQHFFQHQHHHQQQQQKPLLFPDQVYLHPQNPEPLYAPYSNDGLQQPPQAHFRAPSPIFPPPPVFQENPTVSIHNNNASVGSYPEAIESSGGSTVDATYLEKKNPGFWSMQDVQNWLQANGFDLKTVQSFSGQEVDGMALMKLTPEILRVEMPELPLRGYKMCDVIARAFPALRGVNTTTASACCPMEEVICDGSTIIGVFLGDLGLTEIPQALSTFSQLERIVIQNNTRLTTIPSWVGDTRTIKILNFWGSGINSFPSFLTRMSRLESLTLSYNPINGPLPTDLSGMTALTDLYLYKCGLTGSIPPSIGRLTRLENLQLSGNSLTGQIPTDIGNLVNLNFFSVVENQLTGSIPDSIGNLVRLDLLGLRANQLSGTLPSSMSRMANLSSIFMSYNARLTGPLTPLANLQRLDYLNVSHCSFTGEVPAGFGSLPLNTLDLTSNQLTGTPPSGLSDVPEILLDNNCFQGSFDGYAIKNQRTDCANFNVNNVGNPGTNGTSTSSGPNVIPIAVGVSVGVVVLIAAIIAFFVVRKRSRGTIPKDNTGNGAVQPPATQPIQFLNRPVYSSAPPAAPPATTIKPDDVPFLQSNEASQQNFFMYQKADNLAPTYQQQQQQYPPPPQTYMYPTSNETAAQQQAYSTPPMTSVYPDNQQYQPPATATGQQNIPLLMSASAGSRPVSQQESLYSNPAVVSNNNSMTYPSSTPIQQQQQQQQRESEIYPTSQAPPLDGFDGLNLPAPDATYLEKKMPLTWTREDVSVWLASNGFDARVRSAFAYQEIDGSVLVKLSANTLRQEMTDVTLRNRLRLVECIHGLCNKWNIAYDSALVGPETRSSMNDEMLIPPKYSEWIGDLQLTTIPQVISQLTNLESLTIQNNTELSSIPPFLSTMRTLKSLDLWNNNIREFPSFIGDMISLESLGMSQNPLRAPIPDLSRLVNLKELYLFASQLLGSIPASIGGMRSLESLQLSHNFLEGPIPSEIGNLRQLYYLSAHTNNLSGPIPESLGNLVRMNLLSLDHNSLEGVLPSSLSQMTNLSWVGVDSNPKLTGPISPLTNSIRIEYFNVSHCSFTGEIPTTLVNLPNATNIDLSSNQLTGNIPTGFGSVGVVNVEDNCLKGSIGGSRIKNQRDNCGVNPVIGNNNRTDTEMNTGSNNVLPVAVGSAAGILVLIAVLVGLLVFRRRRQRREMEKGKVEMPMGMGEGDQFLPSTSVPPTENVIYKRAGMAGGYNEFQKRLSASSSIGKGAARSVPPETSPISDSLMAGSTLYPPVPSSQQQQQQSSILSNPRDSLINLDNVPLSRELSQSNPRVASALYEEPLLMSPVSPTSNLVVPPTPSGEQRVTMTRATSLDAVVGSLESKSPKTWGIGDVCNWLSLNGFDARVIHAFAIQEVDGSTLLKLDHATLRQDMPDLSLRTRLSILQNLQDLCTEWNIPFEAGIQQQQHQLHRGMSDGYRMSASGVVQPGDGLFSYYGVNLEKLEREGGGGGDLPPEYNGI
ncbi:hypothetical protein HDV05_008136 [Chytridiales sp. JEL 0842]|nr:hypothetical protein HDV05_008136 [Chytridiales sp. JEL 0842]